MSELKFSEPLGTTDQPDSPIVEHDVEAAKTTFCYWKGSAYSVGSINCLNGQLYYCHPQGQWVGLPNKC